MSLACGESEVSRGSLGRSCFRGTKGEEIDGRGGAEILTTDPPFSSSGIFGERLPLRYYLSTGMLLSGLFTSLFGLGYFWNIHVLWYFVLIQVRASALLSVSISIKERPWRPSHLSPSHGSFRL